MNNLRVKTDKVRLVPTQTRVSQRPGSIPASLADLENGETIRRLRAVLNVDAFMRDLRHACVQAAQDVIESELEP